MKKKMLIMAFLAVMGISEGCDLPWRAISTIAAGASNGDYGALAAVRARWLEKRDDIGSESEVWYSWPACSRFDYAGVRWRSDQHVAILENVDKSLADQPAAGTLGLCVAYSDREELNMEFSFTNGAQMLICKYCGQGAGVATTCSVYSDPKNVFI